ncbi:MAG: ATP-binding cassette domain-containing protein [Deltaproteobacteria bacterium]|nr:ATP-binding cassette domain-containing protein [Deltaproteobacteria bacterium]MBW2071709.1 ATP-binding cassette domain-containing protein [Deltaproteobacteria bacterium]
MKYRTGSNGDPIIETADLKKYFPVRRGFLQRVVGLIKAVDGVDLVIPAGQTVSLVGESGCGKSTLAKVILRLEEPTAGRIFYRGEEISGLSPAELKPYRRKMQIIFQDPFGSLNPRMTVGKSIEEGLRVIGLKSSQQRRERLRELLHMVGLPPQAAERYPHEFSGGQRQRIGIARALSVDPELIICDEPVSALDVSIQAQILNLLERLQQELGLSYLFISHDLHVVEHVSDWVAIMYLGHIMEWGPAKEVYERQLHPYSKALLSAAPVPDPSSKRRWEPLVGDVPTPFNPPPGCKFQSRCPLAEERCRQEEIDFYEVAAGHRVRCWKVTV